MSKCQSSTRFSKATSPSGSKSGIRQDETTSTPRQSSTRSKAVSTKTTGNSENTMSSGRLLMTDPHAYNVVYTVWRACAAQAVRDAYLGNVKEMTEVAEWIGTNDFHFVCTAAEIDEDMLAEELRNLMILPPSLRKKYGRLLREKILQGIYNSQPDREFDD